MIRAVVSFADGKKKMGNIVSFNIHKTTFYLETESDEGKPDVETIKLDDVKKIAFRKKDKPARSTIHHEKIEQSTYAGPVAFKLTIEFNDGELLIGSAVKYSPEDKGFFIIPLNPADRNEKIFINSCHIKRVDCKRFLGRHLVDSRQISKNQLNEALRIQAEQRNKRIGSIMLEETMINQNQLDESLHSQKENNIKLGELLFDSGYITREQLEKALNLQKDYQQKKLGQILVALRCLTPNDICLALASQLGYSWVDLGSMEIPNNIIKLLPEEVIRKYEVIPVDRKDPDIIVVASAEPHDNHMRENLKSLTRFKLEFVVAYDGYISELIKRRILNQPSSSDRA